MRGGGGAVVGVGEVAGGGGEAGQVLRRLKAIKSPSDRVVKAEVLGYRSGLGPTIEI